MRYAIALACALTFNTMSSALAQAAPADTAQTKPPLHPLHTTQRPPSSFPFPFTIPPDTDLWFKPAPMNDGPPTSLPIISTSQPTFYARVALGQFVRARVRVSYVPEVLYDQAGLVLLFPRDAHKWIKGGVEYVDGEAKRSVVVTAGNGQGSDWSVSPPSGVGAGGGVDSIAAGRVGAVVEFEREEEGTGTSLFIKIGGEVVREVTWVFAAPTGAAAGATSHAEEEVWIGFYGARPAKADVAGNFTIDVEEWELTVRGRGH